MKSRFTTIDIRAIITEIKSRYLGMRVANVYDIDNKNYLIKLQQSEHKAMLLLESGTKLHSTEFEWPKNMMPSGFSMKLRKHIRGRRLESIEQLGIDRIVDMQFGSGEAAYHIILELYDRGNMVLTDYEYTILNILRPRTDDSSDVRFAVRERYPVEAARPPEGLVTPERLHAILLTGKEGDTLKKILIPHLVYGPAIIEHCLLNAGMASNAKLHQDFNPATDIPQLMKALEEAEAILQAVAEKPSTGYIIQKREKKVANQSGEGDTEASESPYLLTYQEFHPLLLKQHESGPYVEFGSFDKAVDEFFSQLGSQKLDTKLLQQEKQALKKLENVKKDHEKRITSLQAEQDTDNLRAQLIEINLQLVDRAILIVNSALANQVDWDDMQGIVKDAKDQGDPVASAIINLKLATNHITLLLRDPFDGEDGLKPMKVDIDLALSAYSNARKYYDMKRGAAKKEQKTVEASSKALKSAERKTKETLKEVQTVATINKARKTYWFEKFLWFISSENYLVIGGRDQQQNELIVKRYFTATDLYVHADLHGASSVIIKNPHKTPVPPKTLNEAGCMAICNSAAWDAKVVTSAWWVTQSQVSKTAPSGEYLTTGSFMIRGKKNYLPPSYLIYGFGLLFKLDEDYIERHKDDRRVRSTQEESADNDDVTSLASSDVTTQSDDISSNLADDTESLLSIEDGSDSDSDNEHSNGDDNKVINSEDINDSNEESSSNTKDTVKAEKTKKSLSDLDSDVKVKEEQESESDEDDASLFPDTSLALHHVKGGKFTLQRDERSISTSSQQSEEAPVDAEETAQASQISKPTRLSAKQRRDLKKKQKQGHQGGDESEAQAAIAVTQEEPNAKEETPETAVNEAPKEHVPQPKRGHKSKQKKMREKYKDQDEEERQLRMEILASAGGPKSAKGKKKNKQQIAQAQKREQQAQNPQHKSARPRAAKQLPPGRLTLQDITVNESEALQGTEAEVAKPEEDPVSDEEKEAEEGATNTSEMHLIDSLTGQPLPDDVLLFAVPVCAPYSVLTNYKFKVKLLPGTTKRGKAAKSAIHMFQQDRATTQREKDLFKSLKDVDVSRNIPGKVKVSAPNLLKSKGK